MTSNEPTIHPSTHPHRVNTPTQPTTHWPVKLCMAATIRDVVPATVENASTTSTTSKTGRIALSSWSLNNSCHCFLSNILCSQCTRNTLQLSTDSPPYQLVLPAPQQPRPSSATTDKQRKRGYLSAINDQTLDFRHSVSTTLCNCTKCPKEDFKFVNVNSFSRSNISSSTAFDYTTTTTASASANSSDSPVSDNISTEEIRGEYFTPPREYTTNTRALGQLTEKRSPLFGPVAGGISLRTQEPFYSEYLLNANDLISPKSLRAFKENIDYTATEALLSMNGGKRSMNGSVTTSPATTGNGGVTDINRNNNGVPKHWVSFYFYYYHFFIFEILL